MSNKAAKPEAEMQAGLSSAKSPTLHDAPTQGSHDTADLDPFCQDLVNAAAECSEVATCDEFASMYISATSRSAVVAMSKKPGYSEKEFDRYCEYACKNRSRDIDDQQFSKDVCKKSVPAHASSDDGAKSANAFLDIASFNIDGKLVIPEDGISLERLLSVFGQPQKKEPTPYECGSAFDEGDIYLYSYPDFTAETDGKTVIVRTMDIHPQSFMALADGKALDVHTRDDVERIFGSRAEKFGDHDRVSDHPDGNLESAYLFNFDEKGNLISVKFWIGC